MSVGGIFTLVTSDDASDKLFTAMDLLDQRLKRLKSQQGVPSLKFIEQSHIIYTRSQYIPYVGIASEYTVLGNVKFNITNNVSGTNFNIYVKTLSADFLSDCVLHVSLNAVGNKTAYWDNLNPTSTMPLYRYCAYPGIRLLQQVSFNSALLTVDSYTPEDVISYKNFFVNSDHKSGWNRCFGQDEIQQATYNSKSFTGILNYSNGYQTPKLYQEKFEMFIPLQFWFCDDVSQALIVKKLGATQRNFTFHIASLDQVLQSLVYTLDEGQPPNITQAGTQVVPLPITSLPAVATLYGNMLYTRQEVMSVINSEVKSSLIRVHKQQISSLHSPSDIIELKQSLTYPGEYLMVGFRNKNNINDFDRWHLMGSDYLSPDPHHVKILHVPTMVWNKQLQTRQLVAREAIQATSMNAIMDTLSITANSGIVIYPTLPAGFYNSYLPIRYPKNSLVVSPLDNSMFLISFALYPGKTNPSGHFNFSVNREVILTYAMKEHYSANPSKYEYVICMSALNFLMYDKNSASDNLSLYMSM